MKNFLKKHKKLCIVLAIVLILALVFIFVLNPFRKAQEVFTASYTEVAAEKRRIERSITGSGSLQPANSYSVSARYSGEISADYFEEGDTVEKGQELYLIDASDTDSTESMAITAPVSGYISSVSIEKGDTVRTDQVVAQIVDDSQMKLVINFSSVDAQGITPGDAATVVLDSTFEELTGTVESVSLYTEVSSDNLRTRSVTIIVDNPGALDSSYLATAKIGNAVSISPEYFEYISTKSVTADGSGDVYKLYVEKGSRVAKGELIATLSKGSDNMHTVTSPIEGSVVDKSLKEGENVTSGRTLCTIYDLSYLEITLSVDELDIADIEVGQTVEITADAREGESFEGFVSKVSIAGSNNNGTATYPVTIRINDYGDLLPSMTVDATIYITEADDVLAIPSQAIARGNTVLLTQDSPTARELVANGAAADENGYVTATVETGISDDSYIQIISGIEEGDTVAYIVRSSEDSMFPFGNMMGGGDFGGGNGGGGGDFGGGNGGGGGGNMPSRGGNF